MLAVAIVVGVIVIVGLVRGDSGTSPDGGNPVVSAPVATTSSAASTESTTSAVPTSVSAPPTTSAPPPVTSAPPAVVAPAPAATVLQVFNVSHRRGVAQNETDRLRHEGYRVTRVANRMGYRLVSTTVFYDPGNATAKAAAEGLVRRHLGVVAAAPRPVNVPATGTLIVYVTSSYA